MKQASSKSVLNFTTVPSDGWCWYQTVFVLCWFIASMGHIAAALPDKVVTGEGEIFGTVISNSPNAIEFDSKPGGRRQVGVAELVSLKFGEEPQSLTDARRCLLRGDYHNALVAYSGITPSDREAASVLVRAECDYVRAAAMARQVLAAGTPVGPAQEAVETFLSRYSRTIHRYEIVELAGRLALSTGDSNAAIDWFRQLAEGPSALAIRASRLEGEALLAAGDPVAAAAAFEQALEVHAGDAASRQEKLAAKLGRAGSLIERGQANEAVKSIRQLLAVVEPSQITGAHAAKIVAKGYVLLGRGWLAVDQPQDALLAYLAVDLVYPGDPSLHAESLFRLAELWAAGGYPQRAAEARDRLVSRYPESQWAAALSAVAD